MSAENGNGRVINFDLAPVDVKVGIGGEDYILKEASHDTVRAWRNRVMKCTRNRNGVVETTGDLADTESFLVSRCLFRDDGSGALHGVKEEQIKRWPNRIQKWLFEKICEISDITEKETRASLLKQREDINRKLATMEEEEALVASANASSGEDSLGN